MCKYRLMEPTAKAARGRDGVESAAGQANRESCSKTRWLTKAEAGQTHNRSCEEARRQMLVEAGRTRRRAGRPNTESCEKARRCMQDPGGSEAQQGRGGCKGRLPQR